MPTDFRIADTFTDSLARLTGDEQKAVKTSAFDLQLNPANPGLQFHKLDKAKDKNFWSVRVNVDIRMIVHKTSSSLLLCYVDHHDKAYSWAERRKLETHPKTGAAQLVEIRETVKEIIVPVYVHQEQPSAPEKPKQALFADRSTEELLEYGVPAEWMDEVRRADEDSLFALASVLPEEAAEALLELATGGKPRVAAAAAAPASPFEHPDAQRRFHLVNSAEELKLALEYPWDKWMIFLHPEQREWVERDFGGPARISGSAGTGKTIVAIHRAVHLARTNPGTRVLLTTFSDALASLLSARLNRLVSSEPRLAEQIEVQSLKAIAARLYTAQLGPLNLASDGEIKEFVQAAAQKIGDHKFSTNFLISEWTQVVDAWQLNSLEGYRSVARLGRKTRLPDAKRQVLWAAFEMVRAGLEECEKITESMMFTRLAAHYSVGERPPFDFIVVDEAQDVSVSQMKLLAALGSSRPNALFFAGDLGQRIFQQPFSWKSLGVDIRGRSHTLRVNYRTSHQIRAQADRLLGPSISDVDGIVDDRGDAVSVVDGAPPVIRFAKDASDECQTVARWLQEKIEAGIVRQELGVIVRSAAQLPRAISAIQLAEIPFSILDGNAQNSERRLSLCTMHLAKGLEFRAVAVMACDDDVIPLQERFENIGDESDLKEVYDTERHLLYVACTRARDHLLISGVKPASEFLDDLRS